MKIPIEVIEARRPYTMRTIWITHPNPKVKKELTMTKFDTWERDPRDLISLTIIDKEKKGDATFAMFLKEDLEEALRLVEEVEE